jgi:hypothetical protein
MSNPSYLVYIQSYGAPGSSTPVVSVTAPIPEDVMFDMESAYEMKLPQGPTGGLIGTALAAMGMRLTVQALTAQLWAGSTTSELTINLEFHTESDPVADVRTPIVNLMKLVTPATSSTTGILQSPGPQLDLAQLLQIAKDAVSQGSSIFSSIGSGVGQYSTTSTAAGQYSSGAILNGLGGLANPSATTNQLINQSAMVNSSVQTPDGTNVSQFQSPTQNPSIGTAAYWKNQISNRISIQIGNYMLFDNVVITRLAQTYLSNFDAATGLPHHVKVGLAFKPMFILTQGDLDNLYLNPGANSTPSNNNYGFSMSGLAGIGNPSLAPAQSLSAGESIVDF